jgi:hypothetical protein
VWGHRARPRKDKIAPLSSRFHRRAGTRTEYHGTVR